jgi:hypothetical protein
MAARARLALWFGDEAAKRLAEKYAYELPAVDAVTSVADAVRMTDNEDYTPRTSRASGSSAPAILPDAARSPPPAQTPHQRCWLFLHSGSHSHLYDCDPRHISSCSTYSGRCEACPISAVMRSLTTVTSLELQLGLRGTVAGGHQHVEVVLPARGDLADALLGLQVLHEPQLGRAGRLGQ